MLSRAGSYQKELDVIGSVAQSTTVLRDASSEAAFRRDGFLVVDFAQAQVIEDLLTLYERLDSGIESGYYPSLMSDDEAYKAAAHREVTDLVWPLLDEVIVGYEPLLGVFMVKHPGPDTEVVPHQDWIVAAGSPRPTMNVWLPLTPVTTETGEMRVLPGSHRWLEGLRGSPSFPTAWEGTYERVRDELMVTVPLEPGQAMVYDISILHGTPPNRAGATRVVSSLYAIPDDATPVHYHRSPEGTVTGYEVASDFCTTFKIGDVPEGRPFEEIVDYAVEPLTFEQLAARHAQERATA
jgi:hypothetical protein